MADNMARLIEISMKMLNNSTQIRVLMEENRRLEDEGMNLLRKFCNNEFNTEMNVVQLAQPEVKANFELNSEVLDSEAQAKRDAFIASLPETDF